MPVAIEKLKVISAILLIALVLPISSSSMSYPTADNAGLPVSVLPSDTCPTGKLLLHNDMVDQDIRHLYIENANTGQNGEVMVRVRLHEYFQVGSHAIVGSDINKPDAWPSHTFGCTLDSHRYCMFSMTGAAKNYLKDAGSDSGSYEDSEIGSLVSGYEVARTLPASPVITMETYINGIDTYSDENTDACWVADPDGWYYWSKPLPPGEATNLLVEGVVFEGERPDSNYYLALEAQFEAQFVENMDYNGLSDDAVILAATAIQDSQKLAEIETNRFISHMQALETLADTYPGYSGTNEAFYTTAKRKWLPFMFLRSFRYDDSMWTATGGPLDTGFINYVREQEPTLYETFENLDTIPGDVSGTDRVDLKHMAAIITAYQYKTTSAVIGTEYFMTEAQYDELAGWAGDLQQLVYTDIYPAMPSGGYQQYYDKAISLIGADYGSFSMEDLLADVNAVNLYHALSDGSITEALRNYYTDGYRHRFTTFLGNETYASFKARTGIYTKARYTTPLSLQSVWLLYQQNGITELPAELEAGVGDAVADYFWKMKDNE